PLQWIIVAGLHRYHLMSLAEEITNRWISLNTRVYRESGKMVEKYNVMETTLEAGGGEYPVQDGFGWSNGVLLKMISL
ncbi:MAG: alpha,alpha-trehalase, partial [Saprospiraceae bacterium]|nr:alpha,alpha-trehalase [Saprospiraceae bacterium]